MAAGRALDGSHCGQLCDPRQVTCLLSVSSPSSVKYWVWQWISTVASTKKVSDLVRIACCVKQTRSVKCPPTSSTHSGQSMLPMIQCSLRSHTWACYGDGLGKRGWEGDLYAKGWLGTVRKEGNETTCNCLFLSCRLYQMLFLNWCNAWLLALHPTCFVCFYTMQVMVMFEDFPFRSCHQRGQWKATQQSQGIFKRKREKAHIHFNGSTLRHFK